MKPKKGAELILKIDALVFGGNGIGQVEGFKIFVRGVAPGDQVKVRVTKVRSHYAEAKCLELLEASPVRIVPRCKHFGVCGGCSWQFLPYEEQVKVKEQQVRDALSRLGGISEKLVSPIIGNASPWNYRNKMEFSFGTNAEGKVMLGLHPVGYHHEVFDLEECFLQSPLAVEIVKKVRDFANEFKVPVYRSDTHEGLLKTLTIREGKNTGESMVILTTSTGLFERKKEFISLFSGEPRVTSLYWNTVYQVPGQPTWTEENLLLGKKTLREDLILENGQHLEFDILPSAFFQTNTKQAEILYSKVVELAGLSGNETVFDLYCGTGTIALFCAHKARAVYGVEVNEAAVESARSNALRNGSTNVQFYLGTVAERLADLKAALGPVREARPDVVVVDPPRAGLEVSVLEECARFGAGKIVYVSCNPATLARDLKRFSELGYKVDSVQPVDMFPHTQHVECVTLLSAQL